MIRDEILDETLTRPNWMNSEHRSKDKLWLDKNECGDPQLNGIVLQSLSKIPPESVFSYPDLDTLYTKIAFFSEVKAENILITAGSDGAIRACFEASIKPGDKVILTRPTFAMYEVYSKIYGADVTWLDYEESENGPILTVDNIINTIETVKPKMVCLPNPNSPTGTVFSLADMERIISVAEKNNILVLVDEAYYPLCSITVSQLIYKYNCLVVVRSFSKAWGAAGLRVGYALSNKELITLIHKQRPMYEIGNVSAKALEILLDYGKEMRESVNRINAGKKYFQEEMRALGLSTYESYGNFLHVKFGQYSDIIHNKLEDKVYYRKNFSLPCLEGYSRFSATTIEKFKLIVECIKTIMKEYKNEENNENI